MQEIDLLIRRLSQNLDKLGPFLAVAKLGSVSLAAREIGLSQSALSHLISKFEFELDTKCFERKSRGIELTADGQRIADFSKKMFVNLRELAESLRQKPTIATRLKVGTHETLAAHIWPKLIGRLKGSEQDIAISMRSGRIDSLVRELINSELDLILTVEPKPDPRLKIVPLYRGALECFVGPQWSIEKRKAKKLSARLEDIVDLPVFTDLDAHTKQGVTIPRALAIAGIKNLDHFEVGSFEAAINLAAMNLGIAFLPDRNAQLAVKEKRLRKLEIADLKDREVLKYQICISYLEKSPKVAICKRVTELAKDFLG